MRHYAAAGSQPSPVKQGDEKLKAIAARVIKDKRDVVIEVHGGTGTAQKAQARATAVKNKLVNDGVAQQDQLFPRQAGHFKCANPG